MLQNKYILIVLFSLFFYSHVRGQNASGEVEISGTFVNTPAVEFFETLHESYHLQFFYKKEWLDTMKVSCTLVEVPVIEVLNTLFEHGNLSYRFIQGAVVLLPRSSTENRRFRANENLLLSIGNPVNMGRFKQATVRGSISDGKDGTKLPGAIVSVRELEIATSTNEQGEFEIQLPVGRHLIRVDYMGFEPFVQHIELIEDGQVHFDLFEESHNLEEITIKGEKNPISRTQMGISRVDAKLIKELPALMGEADVIKSMIMMPGVQSVGDLSSGFNVRGGNADQNLVLLDGAPIYNTSHLFGFFSMLNPDAIGNVTLYKGGVPASFGERVASIMDIELKDGSPQNLRFYGGIGVINSRITLEGPLTNRKKSSFLLGGRSTYSDWILRKMKNLDFKNSVARFYDINGNVSYHFTADNTLNLMGYISADEFNLSANSLYKYSNNIAALNWKLGIGKKIVSNLKSNYSNYSFSLNDKDKRGSDLNYRLETGIENIGLKYQLTYIPHEKMRFNGGIQLSATKITPGIIKPTEEVSVIRYIKVENEQSVSSAVFIENEMDISNLFSMTAGLRYSRFANFGPATVYLYNPKKSRAIKHVVDSLFFGKNEKIKIYQGFEPRISFKYKLNSGGSIRWNYQRIYQYLNQISNTSVVSPADFWKLSDYHLKPLIADQFAIGYFKNFKLEGFETSAELYYKNLTNIIEYKNGAQLVMNQNLETDIFQTNGYAYGLELFVKKTSGRLNGMLSYTFSRTLRKSDGEFDTETINSGSYYPSVYDKPHDLSFEANFQISRRWRFAGNFVVSSGRPTTLPELRYTFDSNQIVYFSDRNKYRMPTYHRLDLSMTIDENLKKKRSWKGSWTISVYNVYGRHNPYSIYYQRDTHSSMAKRSFGLYKFSVIGIPIPSITYNFRF